MGSGIALSLYASNFLADKIPYVRYRLGMLRTVDPPSAAAILAYGATVASAGRLAVEALRFSPVGSR